MNTTVEFIPRVGHLMLLLHHSA